MIRAAMRLTQRPLHHPTLREGTIEQGHWRYVRSMPLESLIGKWGNTAEGRRLLSFERKRPIFRLAIEKLRDKDSLMQTEAWASASIYLNGLFEEREKNAPTIIGRREYFGFHDLLGKLVKSERIGKLTSKTQYVFLLLYGIGTDKIKPPEEVFEYNYHMKRVISMERARKWLAQEFEQLRKIPIQKIMDDLGLPKEFK